MPKFFIKWTMNQPACPATPEERAKVYQSLLTMVKADLNSGRLTDWGVFVGGHEGYSISELSEADLFTAQLRYDPYVIFEVSPTLSTEQVMESMMKAAAAAQK